jgi:hypothetical protein
MLVNVINEFSLDFVMPISLVDSNMLLCQDMDGLIKNKFWFRVDLFDHGDYHTNTLKQTNFTQSRQKDNVKRVYKQLHIWQILLGDVTVHPTFDKGLITLCQEYMSVK